MNPDPKGSAPWAPPRQLRIAFDPVHLRGMSAAERRTVLTVLATLLMEAVAGRSGGRDDKA